jgi:hypothetical protein
VTDRYGMQALQGGTSFGEVLPVHCPHRYQKRLQEILSACFRGATMPLTG